MTSWGFSIDLECDERFETELARFGRSQVFGEKDDKCLEDRERRVKNREFELRYATFVSWKRREKGRVLCHCRRVEALKKAERKTLRT